MWSRKPTAAAPGVNPKYLLAFRNFRPYHQRLTLAVRWRSSGCGGVAPLSPPNRSPLHVGVSGNAILVAQNKASQCNGLVPLASVGVTHE